MKSFLPIAVVSSFLLWTEPASAQTFSNIVTATSGSAGSPNLKTTGNGSVLFQGAGGTTEPIPAVGAGTRMMWWPAKGAFVAGTVTGPQWNAVGSGSAVFGQDNQVPGAEGFAAGQNNNLGTGWCSVGFGINNTISGSSATSVFGQANYVNWGYNSFVAGGWNQLSYQSSIALGEFNVTMGRAAVTAGRALTSGSAACVVVGISNLPIVGNGENWVGSDPVFIVGNGTAGSQASGESGKDRSNALIVFKNGNVQIPKRQGDIVMGEFGTPGSGD